MGRSRTVGTLGIAAIAAFGLVAAACTPPPPAVVASSKSINFEPPTYATGSVRNQDSPPWTGQDCGATIDQAVVANAGFAAAPSSFGTQSFRLSNEQVSFCFNDAFTPQLANEAGESTAENNGLGGGTRQRFFDASWTFASSTGALQPGLNTQVSPDRGDGARMSFIRMKHTATALELEFVDVDGIVPTTPNPCPYPGGCANFVSTPLGTYDATVPHTVRLTMEFRDGPSNDIVNVYVDGVLKHTGTSWEDYYEMDGESNQPPNDTFKSRTVDSLLFRAAGGAVPSVAGQGFLFDDVSLSSGTPPPPPPPPPLINVHVTLNSPPV